MKIEITDRDWTIIQYALFDYKIQVRKGMNDWDADDDGEEPTQDDIDNLVERIGVQV